MPEDMQFLSNLTHHADLNLNLGSTMTLDFAVHDKPVVNIAFDVADPPPFGRPVWEFFYRFEHYRPVVELGAARSRATATNSSPISTRPWQTRGPRRTPAFGRHPTRRSGRPVQSENDSGS